MGCMYIFEATEHFKEAQNYHNFHAHAIVLHTHYCNYY